MLVIISCIYDRRSVTSIKLGVFFKFQHRLVTSVNRPNFKDGLLFVTTLKNLICQGSDASFGLGHH